MEQSDDFNKRTESQFFATLQLTSERSKHTSCLIHSTQSHWTGKQGLENKGKQHSRWVTFTKNRATKVSPMRFAKNSAIKALILHNDVAFFFFLIFFSVPWESKFFSDGIRIPALLPFLFLGNATVIMRIYRAALVRGSYRGHTECA